jgi:uncharacterized lipoprotein
MTMKHLTLILACCLLAGACASAPRASGGDYVVVVGRSTSTHLKQQLPDIIARHGYRVYRSTESATQLYWETDWLRREVLPSEADAGVLAAMVQLVFDGRERGGVYTLQMRARSRIRTELQPDWVGTPAPPELAEALGRLKLDLEAEFGTGVRRF